MLVAIIVSVVLGISSILGWLLYFKMKKNFINSVTVIAKLKKETLTQEFISAQHDSNLKKIESAFEDLKETAEMWMYVGQTNLLKFAKAYEVVQASDVYQSIYYPSADGESLSMLWLCMQTGHHVRWKFPNADMLRDEARRMNEIADSFEEGKLNQEPVFAAMPIGLNTTVH